MKNNGEIESSIIKGLGLKEVKAEELLKSYNEVVKKKKLTTTKKVLIAVVTISGIAILPVPIVMYTKRRKNYITSYIDFNIDQIEDCEVKFARGTTINNLKAQAVEGYRFDGWYLDGEFQNRMDYDTPIEDVKIIYGRYVKQIVVTINFNGTRYSFTVDENTKLSEVLKDINIEEDEGKRFSGWHINNKYSNPANLEAPLTQNCTLYGKYYLKDRVTVDIDGEQTTYLIEETDTLDTLLAKCDLTYSDICGWFTDDKFVNIATELSNNITLYTKRATLDKLSFTEDGDGYSVQGIDTSIEGEVVIPMYYNDKCVTSVQFTSYASISEVVLPSSVIEIPNYCFQNCSQLNKVNFHNQLSSIGAYAFSSSGIAEVKLPASVNLLGNNSFDYCKQLTDLSFDGNGGLTKIPSYAFGYCSALTSVVLPDSLIELGNMSFLSCKALNSITLPSNLQSIGTYAFYDTGLTEVYIPAGVDTILSKAFTNLDNIVVDKNNTKFDSRNDCNAIMETDTNTLILGSNYTEIPEETVNICKSAFERCVKMKSIKLPAQIKTIGNSAFSNCSSLKSIDFSECNYLTTIDKQSFEKCSSLESIDFTSCKSLTSIGEAAFRECANLKEVNLKGCSSLTEIISQCFYRCAGLESVDFTSCTSLDTIGQNAFSNCENLEKVNFTSCETLNTIGQGAFYNCKSLTEVNLTGCSELSTIDKQSFKNCSSLESIDFTSCKSLTSIGEEAFRDCKNLENIDLTECENLTLIGKSIFYDCKKLSKITIPSSVLQIGQYAFRNCNLTKLNFEDDSTWYKVSSETDWKQMTGGTAYSFGSPEENATWFSKNNYYGYYWYKL